MPPAKPPVVSAGTFAEVIRSFLRSPKFDGLSKSTRTNYRYVLGKAEEVLGRIPAAEMRPAVVQAFLNGLAHIPGQRKVARTALVSLDKWAVVLEALPRSITYGTVGPGGDGGHEPWTDEQVAYAEQHAKPHISRAITLAAATGQRGGDLVRMRWSDLEDYEGVPGINVTQQKTGRKLWIPLTQELQRAMATWEKQPTFLLLKEDGTPWTRQQLSDQWTHERDTRLLPQCKGCVLHGLRATAVVRHRRAGATTLQISAMVGMSDKMVERYCRHSDQRRNALAAVYRLDGTKQERPVPITKLPTG